MRIAHQNWPLRHIIILFFSVVYSISLIAFDAKKIDQYLQTHKNFSGAVLIATGDTTILKKGYGKANYEFDIANDEHTKFCIASNSKTFTAVAIMQLQEKKLLNVQDQLCKYIPDFSEGDTITIHHLLTHTSGIQNYYKQWADIGTCPDLAVMVAKIKAWELEFEPGCKYAYSNTGYLLLAYIIEKISGLSFEQYLQKNIFAPLNMHESGSVCSGNVIKNKASGYVLQNGKLCNASYIQSPLTLVGNGDIYSSLHDLHIFYDALFAGKIITKNSLETMMAQHVPMEGSNERFHGYGFFIDNIEGKRIVEYSGGLVGYLSKVVRFIDGGVTIVIVTNVEDRDEFAKICEDLLKLVATGN